MKKLLYISILIISTLGFQAQNISNGGFENWTGTNINTWSTIGIVDSHINALYTKESNHTEGSFSLGLKTDTMTIPSIGPTPFLINPSLAYGTFTYNSTTGLDFYGLPFTFRPDSLAFDANFTTPSTDTAIFLMYLTKAGNLLGGFGPSANSFGYLTSTGGNWISSSNPITYLNSSTPDSVIILIQSGFNAPKFGSKLLLDNFRFIYRTNTGIYEEYIGSNLVKCFPNPTTDYINIELENELQNAIFEIYDINGNQILIQELTDLNTKIDLNTFTNGAYNYRIIKEHKIYSGHIIINK